MYLPTRFRMIHLTRFWTDTEQPAAHHRYGHGHRAPGSARQRKPIVVWNITRLPALAICVACIAIPIQWRTSIPASWSGSRCGTNSSAPGNADIDTQGNVHPDQFWETVTLGNVKEVPFSKIWNAEHEPGSAIL